MKWTMEFAGGEELAERLNALPMALSVDIRIKALIQAAEPMRSKAEQLAPRSRLSKPHLGDNIIIQKVTRVGSTEGGRWAQTEGDEAWVAVGPSKAFFYGIFQEYGTVHHGAQPFMRPAFDTGSELAVQILAGELWAAIRNALPGSFATATAPTEVFATAA